MAHSSAEGASQARAERCESDPKTTVTKSGMLKGHENSHTTESLWDCAYDTLKRENLELLDKYEKLLSKELLGASAHHPRSRCRRC